MIKILITAAISFVIMSFISSFERQLVIFITKKIISTDRDVIETVLKIKNNHYSRKHNMRIKTFDYIRLYANGKERDGIILGLIKDTTKNNEECITILNNEVMEVYSVPTRDFEKISVITHKSFKLLRDLR